jgi:hypothetical protein
VDLRADLDNAEKETFLTLLGPELRSLGSPAHSQSLYRLRYPGSSIYMCMDVCVWSLDSSVDIVARLRVG